MSDEVEEETHLWTLWTPMDDGSGRWSRYCKDCQLIQTRLESHE